MPALILWDVGCTMLTIEGVSLDIYTGAFRQVTGLRAGADGRLPSLADTEKRQAVLGQLPAIGSARRC
jgi:hypothetical protein